MPNDDNASIRYLMKEMDPSEEVLMERSMMEDEDLLIEVECMRQTLKRLDEDLPEMDPPAHVTQDILNKASKHKPNTRSGLIPISFSGSRIGYVAAAAVMAIGLVSGVLLYQDRVGGTESDSQTQQNSSAASVSSSPTVDVDAGQLNASIQSQAVETAEAEIEPWVDHQQILRFQDQFSEQTRTEFDSMLNTSIQKLKPIDDPLDMGSRSRSLQLTGSEQ
ncbi:hypothetical protein NC796_08430 [Aliifodinibius sp. S!AR15-10]|uniref:hypothetical protein n=1 Tax=Aliifodinibius sp. S!AR15-10 TaxID=2950437 RepID=UPI0028556B59|nr:hypothetical protein [Aliifodinibius sp. S!AR15-10]MDR8391160.1 hypothetical protein [Aliifodinibius sp. S!AR15-10]